MHKTAAEIVLIKEGGAILGAILERVADAVRSGVSTRDLDIVAEEGIREAGGRPAFKGYKAGGKKGFPGTVCTSINDEVVHGIPSARRILQNGDIIGIDIGMEWPYGKGKKGLYTDTALTVPVGMVGQSNEQLIRRTQESLYQAIRVVRPGNTVATIGKAVEEYIKPFGYGIVLALVGHGVGHALHEEPQIPNIWLRHTESITLEPGMVLAIEPMINLGTYEVKDARDGWTIRTRDGKNSAHFEHTVIVEEDGVFVATQRPSEKVAL